MPFLHYENVGYDVARIAIVLNFVNFEPDAAQFTYDANSAAISIANTRADDSSVHLIIVTRSNSLAEASREVVQQIREAEAYFNSQSPFEEPVIEEENIEYPTLRDIDTGGIRAIRR